MKYISSKEFAISFFLFIMILLNEYSIIMIQVTKGNDFGSIIGIYFALNFNIRKRKGIQTFLFLNTIV